MGERRYNQLLGNSVAIGKSGFSKKRKNFKQEIAIQIRSEPKMEGTDKPLTRDELISMQVINAKGQLVGKVKDVVFAIGKMGISITIEKKDGEVQTIGWDEVQAACDYIILKPVAQSVRTHQPLQQTQTPQKEQTTQPTCPTCGKPLTWIPQYQRWYCYNDKKYV